MKRKPVKKYHNTRHLLKQYRKVSYAIQISESDMNVRMEMEHGTRLSTLEVNAELAGVDLSGSKLEGYEGITPYQAENIFRTNIQTAYNVGHYKQMTEPGVKALRPYWQYDAVNDSKTRPSHLAMDGRVFMADDPIWDTWFPPNGFKCRCTVKTLSKRQMEQRGLTVETEAPRAARLEDGRFVNILPDPQFDTNPAKVRYQPDLTGYPEPLKKAYQEREKGNTPP